MKRIKDFFYALFVALLVGIIAGVVARFSIFPIMALLHNKWVNIITSETVKLIYFWIGQIVGSLVLIGFMYRQLRDREWSAGGSVLAVVSAVLLLCIVGLLVGVLLGAMVANQ